MSSVGVDKYVSKDHKQFDIYMGRGYYLVNEQFLLGSRG